MPGSGKNDLYTAAGFKYKNTPIRAVSSKHHAKPELSELLPAMAMRPWSLHPIEHAIGRRKSSDLSLSWVWPPAPVAQWIEHRIPNPGAASSILAGGTTMRLTTSYHHFIAGVTARLDF